MYQNYPLALMILELEMIDFQVQFLWQHTVGNSGGSRQGCNSPPPLNLIDYIFFGGRVFNFVSEWLQNKAQI